jgi:hypothetical protein
MQPSLILVCDANHEIETQSLKHSAWCFYRVSEPIGDLSPTGEGKKMMSKSLPALKHFIFTLSVHSFTHVLSSSI